MLAHRIDIQTLFNYNQWANERVLAAAARVTPEQFVAPAGLSHDSLRGALVHVLAAEVVWRLRCQEGISPRALPAEGDFPALEPLRSRWELEMRSMQDYVDSLTSQDLQWAIHYTTTRGIPRRNVLWHLLAHVVNHGTQFRAEAAVALTRYGRSPGDLDMLAFFRRTAA